MTARQQEQSTGRRGRSTACAVAVALVTIGALQVGGPATAGSSAIPAFRALMHDLVPNAVARDAAAFTSVAAGLAMPGVTEAAVAG